MFGRLVALAASVVLAFSAPALAFEEGDDDDAVSKREGEKPIRHKLTTTYYAERKVPGAFDINLRTTIGDNNLWLGFFRQGTVFQQLRAGFEREIDLPFGELSLTVMGASGGFGGAGAQLQVGHDYFGIVGHTRTNLRRSENLDFDPDDAVIWGGGAKFGPRTLFTMFQVRDDRESTGRRITHYVLRFQPADGQRLTLDLFHRSGWGDDDGTPFRVNATGASVTWDIYPYFARVAFDPKVNFGPNNMWRFAVGFRF